MKIDKEPSVLVIDGQGGKLGREIIETLLGAYPALEVTAVGTNSVATTAMLKGGAKRAATGENAVRVACRRADVVIGPIGIVIADSLMGEVTEAIAVAVGQSSAIRILIPVSRCDSYVAGVPDVPLSALLADMLRKFAEIRSGLLT